MRILPNSSVSIHCAKRALVRNLTWVGGLYSAYATLRELLPLPEPVFVPVLVIWLVSYAFWLAYFLHETCHHTARVHSSGNSIQVDFADDILSCHDGSILVGINDELICTPDRIGPKSLHKQVLDSYGPDWMNRVFAQARQNATPDADGCYPMGYAFTADSPDSDKTHSFVFLVMSKLHQNAAGAQTTEKDVYQALIQLFRRRDILIRNHTLYAPPLGTGEASLSIDKQDMAKRIALAFARSTVQTMSVHKLHIVLRASMRNDIDMAALNADIDQFAQRCSVCSDYGQPPALQRNPPVSAAGIH